MTSKDISFMSAHVPTRVILPILIHAFQKTTLMEKNQLLTGQVKDLQSLDLVADMEDLGIGMEDVPLAVHKLNSSIHISSNKARAYEVPLLFERNRVKCFQKISNKTSQNGSSLHLDFG
jgi:hypothetical protein